MIGMDVLLQAIKDKDATGIKALLERGTALDDRDDGGLTPLMWLAITDWSELVPDLVQRGASLEVTDGEGRTALIWAAEVGHLESVHALLEAGANVWATNHHGHTARWYAEWQEDEVLANLLKEYEENAVL